MYSEQTKPSGQDMYSVKTWEVFNSTRVCDLLPTE